jgi:hypothetical protein
MPYKSLGIATNGDGTTWILTLTLPLNDTLGHATHAARGVWGPKGLVWQNFTLVNHNARTVNGVCSERKGG